MSQQNYISQSDFNNLLNRIDYYDSSSLEHALTTLGYTVHNAHQDRSKRRGTVDIWIYDSTGKGIINQSTKQSWCHFGTGSGNEPFELIPEGQNLVLKAPHYPGIEKDRYLKVDGTQALYAKEINPSDASKFEFLRNGKYWKIKVDGHYLVMDDWDFFSYPRAQNISQADGADFIIKSHVW